MISFDAQGEAPRVLFLCTMGMFRSPTAMFVAQKKFKWNTRCAGTSTIALIPVTDLLIRWASVIYCMSFEQKEGIVKAFPDAIQGKRIRVLDIPDNYEFMDPELQGLIASKLEDFNAVEMQAPE
ncbi:MAG: phosphotyrosine protein phosphatase [Nitrospiraceae bacterium]